MSEAAVTTTSETVAKTEAPPAAPVEKPVAKAPQSRAFLDSLDATRKERAEQLSWRTEKAKADATLKEYQTRDQQIAAARASGDIATVHKLLNIAPETTRAFLVQQGAPKPDDKFSAVERQLKETQERLAAFESETKKAQEAVGNREQEAAQKEFIDEVHGEVEKYPLIGLLKQGAFVAQMARQEAQKSGRMPDIEAIKAGVEKNFEGLLEQVAEHPKGLAVLEALIARKRGMAAAKPAEKPSTTVGPAGAGAAPDSKSIKFGGQRTVLQEAMAEAEAEVAARVKK